MKEVVIVSAVRTPIGAYGGAFKDFSAVELGVVAVKEALNRANVNPEMVDEVIFGNVLQAGLGQNVARQVSMGAGIPEYVTSFTVNKVCGSGLKTVALAAQAIKAGDADIVVVGGTENMSQAPYLLKNHRWGQRMGNGEILDYMVDDGLTDVFNHYHMGITAENVDTRTELKIQEAMIALMENRTTFIIAHRLSTIRDADIIMMIDDGRIIEKGTHEELIAKKGAYFNLYMSQYLNTAE